MPGELRRYQGLLPVIVVHFAYNRADMGVIALEYGFLRGWRFPAELSHGSMIESQVPH